MDGADGTLGDARELLRSPFIGSCFSDHLNTVRFDLVVPKNLDECSERCQSSYEWAISVFYSGLSWHRVCQADKRDNNVNGRTDELGEHCWMDPVNGLET